MPGGDAPPFWLTFAVIVLAAPICVALVGARPARVRGLPRLAAAVALYIDFIGDRKGEWIDPPPCANV